jgi:hypothetical protein
MKNRSEYAMTRILVEKITDSSDCDTCGCSFADGARVHFDGQLVLELLPVADCDGGKSYGDDEVYAEILRHLGHGLVYSSEEGAALRLLAAMGHEVRVA